MQLNFRDLKQQNFSIDAEPSETIADVKSKIATEKGFDAAQLKLIYSGKILKDTDTVESYKFEAKSYIVCMQQKPKPAPAAAASSSRAPSTPAPVPAQTPSAPAPAPAAPNTSNAPATPSPAPAQPTSPREFNDPSSMTLGNEREAAISNLVSMDLGSRADVEAAMRAAFYNPDRAVEYLLNGIPENLRQQAPAQRPASGQQPPASTTQGTTGATETATAPQPGGGGGGGEDEPVNLFEAAARASQGGNRGGAGATGARSGGAAAAQTGSGEANPLAGAGGNLDFLRDNQTFQHLRQLVQQQPQMLEQVLQQVGASNPQLAGLIASNPEQFLQLLAEGDGGEEGGTPLPPGAQPISVTEEERDAIERLCRLGFERDLVIQAYFACDKNEELAANFLFDQPDEGDDGAAPPGS